MKAPFTLHQRSTIVVSILCIVLSLVVMQLWLLSATMEAFLGGDNSIVWPAAAASLVLFALNFGLLHFYLRILSR
ncbi:MAG TPA: DUF6755 family protein [Planctomycetota bacterium]|nr:DUF6755 family protein [Planctomycetota bacterium]